MLELSFLIGIYAYIIFFLGILGLLYKNVLILITLIFVIFGIVLNKKKLTKFIYSLNFKKLHLSSKILLLLIFVQVVVNFIGALGPEISFDALWYHLTIPKIFLLNNTIFHIPGNLLYYSDLPKLTEMLFVVGLAVGNEIMVKLMHFTFGLLILIAIYKITRKFLSINYSLLSVIIFYSSLVVGWLSITAYNDLATTFFTLISVYCFLQWIDNKTNKNVIYLAIIVGLTIATKIVALNLIPIYIILIFAVLLREKIQLKQIIYSLTLFSTSAILVASPWFVFAFLKTGNPFYPLFDSSLAIVNTFNIFGMLNLFLYSSDPINPIYLILLPIIFYYFVKFSFKIKVLALFVMLGVVFWYFDSQVGGSRFVLPYLPIFSIVVVYALALLKNKSIKNVSIALIITLSIISIFYRGLANSKFVPVILGQESKATFLTKHLNFSFGDFYDTDGYFKTHLKNTDKVLMYGFHNLYYVDFPFIDSSFVRRGDKFNYVVVQDTSLPSRFSNWKEIYNNNITRVRLYSLEGKQWVY